jgi:hypothetical protein
MNEQMADGIRYSATSERAAKCDVDFMSVRSDGVSFDRHTGHESAFVSAQTLASWLDSTVGKGFGDGHGIVSKAIRRSFCLASDELNGEIR